MQSPLSSVPTLSLAVAFQSEADDSEEGLQAVHYVRYFDLAPRQS
jgi:hypothetical protein